MAAEARHLGLWSLPTPAGTVKTWWSLAPVNGPLHAVTVCGSQASSAPGLETPHGFHPQGPHRTRESAWPHLPQMAHSEWAVCILQRSPLGVWSAGSPASPPLVSPEKQLLQEQSQQLGGLFRKSWLRLPLESSQPCSQRCPRLTIKKPPCPPPAIETTWGRDSTGAAVPVGAMQAPGSPHSRSHKGAP